MKKLSIILIGMSLAAASFATEAIKKQNIEYEKITIISDSADYADFMHSEAYGIIGEIDRGFEYKIVSEGFHFLPGYDSACSCGQLNYPGNSISRQEWRDLVTRNYYNDTSLTRISLHKERSGVGKVPLHRTGIITSIKGTAYTEALHRKLKKAGYKVYAKNRSGTISPLVGKDSFLGWRNKPRLQNYTSSHLDY